jgi:hypothetical protein
VITGLEAAFRSSSFIESAAMLQPVKRTERDRE